MTQLSSPRFLEVPRRFRVPSASALLTAIRKKDPEAVLQACNLLVKKKERKRTVVVDRWTTLQASGGPFYGAADNQLQIASGADIVAAIVTNSGFTASKLLMNDTAIRPQIEGTVCTSIRATPFVTALEELSTGVFVLNADLSRSIEEALSDLLVVCFRDSSDTYSLAPTPVYHYATGTALPEHLWQPVLDEQFHFELQAPPVLPVLNPSSLRTRVYAEVRLECVFEDVPTECRRDENRPAPTCPYTGMSAPVPTDGVMDPADVIDVEGYMDPSGFIDPVDYTDRFDDRMDTPAPTPTPAEPEGGFLTRVVGLFKPSQPDLKNPRVAVNKIDGGFIKY